jgi:hypothetical protein
MMTEKVIRADKFPLRKQRGKVKKVMMFFTLYILGNTLLAVFYTPRAMLTSQVYLFTDDAFSILMSPGIPKSLGVP